MFNIDKDWTRKIHLGESCGAWSYLFKGSIITSIQVQTQRIWLLYWRVAKQGEKKRNTKRPSRGQSRQAVIKSQILLCTLATVSLPVPALIFRKIKSTPTRHQWPCFNSKISINLKRWFEFCGGLMARICFEDSKIRKTEDHY